MIVMPSNNYGAVKPRRLRPMLEYLKRSSDGMGPRQLTLSKAETWA